MQINPDYIPTHSDKLLVIGFVVLILGIVKHLGCQDEQNHLDKVIRYYLGGFCLIMIAFLMLIFAEFKA
ncbi:MULTISPECIES: hypothetical protein [unclassified Arcicella]|uniref:hypothetical protein n=1 Tax=unclassified Arcicella TaxID=2644986 RepID=UPI00285E5FCA|nr:MULTISPECIES: hypothetical protein [unclassified Arcicella]MDR6564930.1 fumarate reductase subunit D [Arcicella sp. BE51]MDR6814720.1 fumarate reductase subunit D [Arcicella sp. BE140]MDR6826166.1 fumarate reductase subunit D [Arcicella sp. BE139]